MKFGPFDLGAIFASLHTGGENISRPHSVVLDASYQDDDLSLPPHAEVLYVMKTHISENPAQTDVTLHVLGKGITQPESPFVFWPFPEDLSHVIPIATLDASTANTLIDRLNNEEILSSVLAGISVSSQLAKAIMTAETKPVRHPDIEEYRMAQRGYFL